MIKIEQKNIENNKVKIFINDKEVTSKYIVHLFDDNYNCSNMAINSNLVQMVLAEQSLGKIIDRELEKTKGTRKEVLETIPFKRFEDRFKDVDKEELLDLMNRLGKMLGFENE